MPLRQLRAIYEKRRNILSNMLKGSSKMDRCRKEQLNGAISEIDTFLKTIDDLRQQEIEDNAKLEYKTAINSILKKANFINKFNEKIRVRFDQSKTKQNLIHIFLRKCETRMKYEFFAKRARNEGFEHIAHIFTELSQNETEHSLIIFDFLGGVHTTPENVREAADIEHNYHKNLYTEFENVARHENFKDIAELFKNLADIEAEHEKKLLKILRNFHESTMFKSEHLMKWKCRNCGHVTESKEAPKRCPVCKQSQAYFEVQRE